jgi:hypothetical protein
MKLFKILTFRKLFTNICVLIALIACGSNGLQLRDSGKAIQTGASSLPLNNQIFLEKNLKKKKNKKGGSSKLKTKTTVTNSNSKVETQTGEKTREGEETKVSEGSESTWGSKVNNIPHLAGLKVPHKNDTLSKAIFRGQSIRKWDFKLLDKQLSEIASLMNYQGKGESFGLRGFIRFFISYFEACDHDADNQLSREEFRGCMKNDSFLSFIDVPTKNHSALFENPLNYTNVTIYADTLFNLLDEYDMGYLNFYSYMQLRLFIFSWRECGVGAPFIEETNFECAIEIAAGWKTMNRNTVRRLFFNSLEFSGNPNIRNLDFITYVSFAQAVRLYGKINGKMDNDITRNELNTALDNNILPLRYNQKTIDAIFKLIEYKDMGHQGLDILTFTFYDFFLKIFHQNSDKGKYKINYKQFEKCIESQLFPRPYYHEILKIPQNNLTPNSYRLYTYLNVGTYEDESDHFLKSFIEKEAKFLTRNNEKAKWSNEDNYRGMANFKFNSSRTLGYIFNSIDSDMGGSVGFYDFGNMIQIIHLFTHFDVYNQGRLTAGELYEKFSHYDDYPMVSFRINERGHIFNEFPQDLYVDVYSAILTLRIGDLFKSKIRATDNQLVTEVDLKHVLAFINRQSVPDAHLNKCLRAPTKENIPLYDWECSFVQAEVSTMVFYENSFDRLITHKIGLNLTNTVFYGKDSSLPNPTKH